MVHDSNFAGFLFRWSPVMRVGDMWTAGLEPLIVGFQFHLLD